MAVYPVSIIAFTTKTDKVDLAAAADINTLQNEVTAVQTELGKLIKGTTTDLKARLAVSLAADGAIVHSPSFVANPITGQPVYRNDLGILYIWTGSSWQPAVTGPTNLFSAYNSASQTNIGSVTQVTFDTEDFDTGGNFASSTFTAPSAGKYLFTVGLDIDVTVAGNERWGVFIYVNGTKFSILDGFNTFSTAQEHGCGGSIILNLSATDTVKIFVDTIAGSSGEFSIIHGADQSRFTGCKLSN